MRLVDFLDKSPALNDETARFIDLDNDISLSYQEMVNASWQVAALLEEKGITSGDVVATYAPNSVAAYCCIFAISRIGAIWVPLNIKNTADANLGLLKKSNALLLFVDDAVATVIPELSDHFSGDNSIPLSGQKIGGKTIQSLVSSPDNIENSQDQIEEKTENDQAIISLFSTGGTTGASKLAEWGSLTWDTMARIQSELMPPPDIPGCYLVAAPMTHAAGVASFVPILQGATVLVTDGVVPENFLSAIERYRVTHVFLPPTAIYILLNHDGVQNHDYSSLRYFWYAAAPMSADKLREAMAVFGPVMVQSYGQAEAPMLCSFLSVQDHLDALRNEEYSILRSCGKTSPYVELAIVDEEGIPLPIGQEGEIAVKGGLLMRGYYNDPAATHAIRKGGWQHTGDIGIINSQGYISIVDRKRDMIITGGFNVYPSEIEQILWGYPDIQDCAVIGVPDEKWGEQVTAVIELKDKDTKPDVQKIIAYCKQKLGSVKTPKEVLIWDELPRSPVGKVLKKDIRKFFWDKAGRKI